jgi:hypothetical protein
MLPLIATGEIGVLGYYFLNDAAWHTALIEWLHAHGAHSSAVVDSSWTAVSQQVAQGYPLGTYVWPLIGITFTGSSAFALWTPSCALTLAMLALLVQRIARRSGAKSGWSAALAVPIAAGYLPLSFLAQGGLKELLFAFALLAAAWSIADIEITEGSGLGTQIRALLGGAIGLAALITIFGPGGAAWILPAPSACSRCYSHCRPFSRPYADLAPSRSSHRTPPTSATCWGRYRCARCWAAGSRPTTVRPRRVPRSTAGVICSAPPPVCCW